MNEESNNLDELFQEIIDGNTAINDNLNYIVLYVKKQEEKEKQLEEQHKKQEEQQKKEEEQQKKEEEQLQKEEQQKEEQQIKSEQTTEQREVTTAETIQHIDEQVTLTNQLFVGQLVFIGVILGVVLMKIFWDRFHI